MNMYQPSLTTLAVSPAAGIKAAMVFCKARPGAAGVGHEGQRLPKYHQGCGERHDLQRLVKGAGERR